MKFVPATVGLTEFRIDAAEPTELPEMLVKDELHLEEDLEPQSRPADLELRAAVELAVREAKDEADVAWSEKFSEARQAAEELLERERSQWLETCSHQLSEHIASQFESLRQQLAEQIFAQCRPVLAGMARSRAIEELVHIADTLVATNCCLQIAGPVDLIDELRLRLVSKSIEADWLPGKELDVSITAGETIVATTLTDWLGESADSKNDRT